MEKEGTINQSQTTKEYGELMSNEFNKGYAKGYTEALAEQKLMLDKLRNDIQKLRGCSCSCSDGIIDDIEDIIDEYTIDTSTAPTYG